MYGYSDASDSSDEMDQRMSNGGFTNSEVFDLACQGVKPWDDDAHAVLAVLNGDTDYVYGDQGGAAGGGMCADDRRCCACSRELPKSSYSNNQFKKSGAERRCKGCVEGGRKAGDGQPPPPAAEPLPDLEGGVGGAGGAGGAAGRVGGRRNGGDILPSECDYCGGGPVTVRCSGCKLAVYCSTDCQKGDWEEVHNDEECQEWRKAGRRVGGSDDGYSENSADTYHDDYHDYSGSEASGMSGQSLDDIDTVLALHLEGKGFLHRGLIGMTAEEGDEWADGGAKFMSSLNTHIITCMGGEDAMHKDPESVTDAVAGCFAAGATRTKKACVAAFWSLDLVKRRHVGLQRALLLNVMFTDEQIEGATVPMPASLQEGHTILRERADWLVLLTEVLESHVNKGDAATGKVAMAHYAEGLADSRAHLFGWGQWKIDSRTIKFINRKGEPEIQCPMIVGHCRMIVPKVTVWDPRVHEMLARAHRGMAKVYLALKDYDAALIECQEVKELVAWPRHRSQGRPITDDQKAHGALAEDAQFLAATVLKERFGLISDKLQSHVKWAFTSGMDGGRWQELAMEIRAAEDAAIERSITETFRPYREVPRRLVVLPASSSSASSSSSGSILGTAADLPSSESREEEGWWSYSALDWGTDASNALGSRALQAAKESPDMLGGAWLSRLDEVTGEPHSFPDVQKLHLIVSDVEPACKLFGTTHIESDNADENRSKAKVSSSPYEDDNNRGLDGWYGSSPSGREHHVKTKGFAWKAVFGTFETVIDQSEESEESEGKCEGSIDCSAASLSASSSSPSVFPALEALVIEHNHDDFACYDLSMVPTNVRHLELILSTMDCTPLHKLGGGSDLAEIQRFFICHVRDG